MKSIKDYVSLEQNFYQNVFDNKEKLYGNKFDKDVLKHISNIVIFATSLGIERGTLWHGVPFC